MGESAGTNRQESRKDERQSDRLAILGELRGEVMVFQPLSVTEISLKGAQIETAFPLHLDSLHDFRLTLGERSIIVKGRVVHCWISDVNQEVVQYCSGVEFVEPSARVTEVIQGFLHDIKSGRGPAR